MYLELERIKKHLNLDTYFTEDDKYILYLAQVAEEVVQRHIDANLKDIAAKEGGILPPPLLHAMLLFIGDMYASRESVSYANAVEIPFSYEYLLSLYKDYSAKI